MKSKNLLWLTGTILLLISAVIFFTRPFLQGLLRVEDGVAVADIINGVTAPIIGLMGAALVYFSFSEQVKANRMQFQAINEQRELDIMYRLYEELKGDLMRIQSIYGEKYQQPNILDSFINYMDNERVKGSPYPELSQYLTYIFSQFIFVSKRLNLSKILSDQEFVFLVDKVNNLYQLYFQKYHKVLSSKIYTTEWVTSFKKSIDEVNEALRKLNELKVSKLN